MSASIIELSAHRKTEPLRWGASVILTSTESGDVEAKLSLFFGQDGLEPGERMMAWAGALDRLASTMRATAADISENGA